jgi:hypothetical protein
VVGTFVLATAVVALPLSGQAAAAAPPVAPSSISILDDGGQDFELVATVAKKGTYKHPGTGQIVTADSIVMTYVPKSQKKLVGSSAAAVLCSANFQVFAPTRQGTGSRYTADGFTQLDYGSSCNGTVTWLTQLFSTNNSQWRARSRSGSVTTSPGQTGYALASSSCSTGLSSRGWLNTAYVGGSSVGSQQSNIACDTF